MHRAFGSHCLMDFGRSGRITRKKVKIEVPFIMKIKPKYISGIRTENKKIINLRRNIISHNNSITRCNALEHVSIEVVVEGRSYNIEIPNKKINEVFIKTFPHL